MGMGSLKRIAVLSLLATLAVFAMGAMAVSALTVPSTTVTVPTTTVTVETPTVRVPSTTTPTPPPAPTVTAPAPAPKAPKAPKAPSAPVKPVTKPVTDVVKKTTGTVTTTVPKATGTVKKTVGTGTKTVKQTTGSGGTGGGTKSADKVVSTLTGGGSGGGSGPAGTSGPVDRIIGTVTGGLGGTTVSADGTLGGSSAGSTTGLVTGADGQVYLAVPGGGASGPGGGSAGGGLGGLSWLGGAGGGGGTLAAMLAGASPKQLRAVLEHLDGCMPALPAIDRQVISMRAGVNGKPMTRPQIGARLGMSRETVRQTERRALNRLQYAAANTNCAGAVVGPFDAAGIGNLIPQLLFAGPVPVNGSSGLLAAGSPGPFTQVRGIVDRSASPLFALGGSGGGSGPAWAIILFTVLFSVSIAALTRELRSSF
jgi:DNA-binding CsgD family transcriptional regulator